MYHNIGKAIKHYRTERNITKDMLADKLGVSTATVSNYENGTTLPDMEAVVTMAHFFSCSAEELLFFSGYVHK